MLHCKKRLTIFPSPAGMSLTKLYLVGNNIINSRPGRVWLVTSQLWAEKSQTFFTVYGKAVIVVKYIRGGFLLYNILGGKSDRLPPSPPPPSHTPSLLFHQVPLIIIPNACSAWSCIFGKTTARLKPIRVKLTMLKCYKNSLTLDLVRLSICLLLHLKIRKCVKSSVTVAYIFCVQKNKHKISRDRVYCVNIPVQHEGRVDLKENLPYKAKSTRS